MKKILSILTIASFMVACNSKPSATTTTTETTAVPLNPAQDTTGLAAYRQWKAQNELATPNQNTTTPQKTVVVYKNAPQATHRSAQRASSSPVYSNTSESGNTAKAPAKKGWSKGAKGAVIGGVVGAGAGAVLDKKNRGVGAIIGGVVGAGAGYGIGHHKDKKDGRQ